jgi:cytochrome c
MFLLFSCGQEPVIERPVDNWAFRSVLDGKPRMLTLALDTGLYVSYDLQTGKIYKAWQGGVRFDGAVYTTAHGVQPTSYGYDFFVDKLIGSPWKMKASGVEEIPELDYLGYSKKRGNISIDFELTSDKGEKLVVRETPDFIMSENGPELSRTFEILNRTSNLIPSLNYSISADKVAFTSNEGGNYSQNSQNVSFELNEDKSKLVTNFSPVPEGWSIEKEELKGPVANGLSYIGSNDCATCHLKEQDLVGPSYAKIAEKYEYTTESVKTLGSKIVDGGVGVWGEVPMTPHPTVARGRAENMAHYILSLDGEELPTTDVFKVFLEKESVDFVLNDENKRTEEESINPGVAVNFYMLNNLDKLYKELTDKTNPTFHGVAPEVHLTGSDSTFQGVSRFFYTEFKGYINSDKAQSKYIRIASKEGSKLYVNGRLAVDNGGFHWHQAEQNRVGLKKGRNEFTLQFFNRGNNHAISLQWSDDGETYELIPASSLTHSTHQFERIMPFVPREKLLRNIPGDKIPLVSVHPSFDVSDAKPKDFIPRIGGIEFISETEMVICTWDSVGAVYILKKMDSEDPEQIVVKRIAEGLAEPLGIKMVDGELFVLQKQELTQLIDNDGDEIIDEYKKVANDWHVTDHYHEFAFGLVYKEGHFYATLATDLGEQYREVKDRGRVVRINKESGEVEFIAKGFRTPNGIGEGPDGAMYVADNQGNWIPTSKIVRVEEGGFYGFKYADYEEVKDRKEDPPLVWLPHVEISNSPSQPAILNLGPYKDQMIHGDVTHGGIKRVFIDEVDGVKQGAAFRFVQGLDAGINRIIWGPDGSLYAGGIGSGGNWRHEGRLWHALHKLTYNEKSTFEMLSAKAKSNGMEIEFTEPIHELVQLRPEDFDVQQYYYVATERYGGPKNGVEDIDILSVNISDDRRKIFIELADMKEGYVIYVRAKNPFRSELDHELWSTETWYTLNKKPENNPGFKQSWEVAEVNTLSQKEKDLGWEMLFDGKTKNGWHTYLGLGDDSKWVVTPKGELHLTDKGGKDLVTDAEYENYELSLEWKIVKGGNSGIIFNVVEDEKYKAPYLTGPEMQILDNEHHGDGRYTTHRAGDLYDMIECKFVTANPGDEWNRITLKIKDGKAEHWQNGYKVVEYQMFDDNWTQMIANSKFKRMEDFGKSRKGRIVIQDHGDKLWMRNIKIRKL